MTRNVHQIDRGLRAVLGLGLVAVALAGPLAGVAALAVGAAGAVFATTAAVGFCPIYRLLGVSSLPKST